MCSSILDVLVITPLFDQECECEFLLRFSADFPEFAELDALKKGWAALLLVVVNLLSITKPLFNKLDTAM